MGHDGDVGVEVRLDGPVLCEGTAGSGRAAFLRAVVHELVASHAPDEVTVALAGAKDTPIADIDGAPHVAALAGADGLDLFVRALDDELWRRRTRQVTGPEPTLLVVVDDVDELGHASPHWAVLRQIARFGRALGMHLLLAAQHTDQVFMHGMVGCRIEVSPSVAVVSAEGQSRYVTPDPVGPLAPKPGTRARNLLPGPEVLDYARLLVRTARDHPEQPKTLPLGLYHAPSGEHGVLQLSQGSRPHLWIEGDRERGKTATLRTLLRGVMDRYTKDEAVVILVDLRRCLAGFVDADRLIGYAESPAQLSSMLDDVVASMNKRLNDQDDWTGPRLYLVVDDYDLLLTRDGPLDRLTGYLEHGDQIGLHLIVAGATGIGDERVLRQMAILDCWGIELGERPGTGRLAGTGSGGVSARLAWVPPTA